MVAIGLCGWYCIRPWYIMCKYDNFHAAADTTYCRLIILIWKKLLIGMRKIKHKITVIMTNFVS